MSTGPSEEWRILPRNENYEVSSLGRVRRCTPYRSTQVGKILKQRPDKDGYSRVGICLKGKVSNVMVHILVCEAFHGPKPSEAHEVAHGDGDRANCSEGNLRWATPKENHADRSLHGTDPFGERNPNRRLTSVEIWSIRARHFLGEPKASLSRSFGVSDTHIGRVVSGVMRATDGIFEPISLISAMLEIHQEAQS